METVSNENGHCIFIKRKSVNFPKLLKDYIDERFFPEYKKFIHFLEKNT